MLWRQTEITSKSDYVSDELSCEKLSTGGMCYQYHAKSGNHNSEQRLFRVTNALQSTIEFRKYIIQLHYSSTRVFTHTIRIVRYLVTTLQWHFPSEGLGKCVIESIFSNPQILGTTEREYQTTTCDGNISSSRINNRGANGKTQQTGTISLLETML